MNSIWNELWKVIGHSSKNEKTILVFDEFRHMHNIAMLPQHADEHNIEFIANSPL